MNDMATYPSDALDERTALTGRALAHPARVAIVRLLAEQDACAGAEVFAALPLAQSTISQHLAVLKNAGLIRATPHGTRMVYCLVPEVLDHFTQTLADIRDAIPTCAREGAE